MPLEANKINFLPSVMYIVYIFGSVLNSFDLKINKKRFVIVWLFLYYIILLKYYIKS